MSEIKTRFIYACDSFRMDVQYTKKSSHLLPEFYSYAIVISDCPLFNGAVQSEEKSMSNNSERFSAIIFVQCSAV